jgi:hypothetical protein
MKNLNKREYSFKDLFSADRNLTEEGKAHRAKVKVGELIQLEKLYPMDSIK